MTAPVEPSFTVCLYRATDHMDRMAEFLTAVGLHQTVRRDADGAAFMWGRGGMVALFPTEGAARPSRAELTLETPDIAAAEEMVTAAGLKSLLIADDNFPGLSVAVPDGRTLWIAETFRDPDDQGSDYPQHAVDVMALHHPTDPEVAMSFYEVFGFHPAVRGDNMWTIMFNDESSGAIAVESRTGQQGSGPIMVQLGFRTEEPLAEVAERLRAAGHEVGEVTQLGGFPFLTATDPDQITVGIFQVEHQIP